MLCITFGSKGIHILAFLQLLVHIPVYVGGIIQYGAFGPALGCDEILTKHNLLWIERDFFMSFIVLYLF